MSNNIHTESVNVRIRNEGSDLFDALATSRLEIDRLQRNGYTVHQIHIDEEILHTLTGPPGIYNTGHPISIIASRNVEDANECG